MDTTERIERIFRDALDIEVPTPATDVLTAGLLDSLGLVKLLFEIEQEYGLTIPLEALDIESLRTVEQIAALVEGLSGVKGDPRL